MDQMTKEERLRLMATVQWLTGTYAKYTEAGCLEYRGMLNNGGYPRLRISINGKYIETTFLRAMFYTSGFELTKYQYVCHKCDNKRCINMRHVYLGNAKSNFNDLMARGPAIQKQQRRLTYEKYKEIRQRRLSGEIIRIIAQDIGMSRKHLGEILKAEYYKDYNDLWTRESKAKKRETVTS